jgi:hypothetical protein
MSYCNHSLSKLATAAALATNFLCQQAAAQDHPLNEKRTSVAQAGSTGGSIGKQDKSISGGGEQPSVRDAGAHRPKQQNAEDPRPKAIQLNDHALGRTYSITLNNAGGNVYRGTWSHGYVTSFTVTNFTKDSIKLHRQDDSAFLATSGTYTGSRNGNHATGQATCSNGVSSNWDASW